MQPRTVSGLQKSEREYLSPMCVTRELQVKEPQRFRFHFRVMLEQDHQILAGFLGKQGHLIGSFPPAASPVSRAVYAHKAQLLDGRRDLLT